MGKWDPDRAHTSKGTFAAALLARTLPQLQAIAYVLFEVTRSINCAVVSSTRSRRKRATALAALVLAFIDSAVAFQIHANVGRKDVPLADIAGRFTRIEQYASDRLLGVFKSPVHEAITHTAFGCSDSDPIRCTNADRAPPSIIWGVRWNDDPPFKMKPGRAHCTYEQTIRAHTQPRCWYQLFKDGEARALRGERLGPGYALLYRTHFGDLQFIHAMASEDSEPPQVTRANILLWAEFAWTIATVPDKYYKYIRDLGIGRIGEYFPGEITASNLLSLGNPDFQTDRIDAVALGTILHMVQDSFSAAHVARNLPTGAPCPSQPYRAPGLITQFHNYVHQDQRLHDEEDRLDALRIQVHEENVTAVSVSRDLVELWKQGRRWPVVRPYFECIFALSPSAAPAGPGEEYRK